ncbi:WD40-repeat-containing domain protein [Mucor mucedo]|uniref:WD40-repeat-containing domain protein n=1 Tax=Mucor mucedo TaxID=29922 RepID=UPI002220522A|nr:WD40-repeat-containing domain protein [Mucor mucedo]KAI7892616.1 WD40-repeat-containing domain protein [Mucor mucedo]
MNPGENKPAPLQFDDNIFHVDLHPSNDIVATGMINGRIQCHRYGLENHEHLWTAKAFKKSCRGVSFTPDGSNIWGISRDRSIQLLDTETGEVIRVRETTHDSPINSLFVIDERMLATGDDQGVIKTLLAVGGDGYLSTWDIRKPDVAAMSDQIEDELLSIELCKNGKKAVVGTQDGVLSLWSWGDWGDYNDRIMGHPNSIEALCKLDEDTLATGSSDGIIRLVTVLPNEFQGVLGDHGEDMPIENLRLSHDKKYLVSSGHDDKLQFWDVAHLFDEEAEFVDEDKLEEKAHEQEVKEESVVEEKKEESDDGWGTDSDDEKDKKKRKKTQKKNTKAEKKKGIRSTAFFADM